MFIQQLTLVDFKNYNSLKLSFSHRINCFVGKNGGGKTNLLDAIHYLCICKSYFNAIDSQNIRHGQSAFKLEGMFIRDDVPSTISCKVAEKQKKEFLNNGTRYNRLSEHVGEFPVVIIAPDDMIIINGGSDERRKAIDNTMAQIDKQYLQDLMNYNKVLLQRNATLKQFSGQASFDESMLTIWDEKLIVLGEKIYHARTHFLKKLVPVFQRIYQAISCDNEKSGLRYRSDLQGNEFSNLLESARQKDRILQRTTKGTHRDDILFTLDDYPAKKFGSQGQQKSYLIAFKLSLFEIIRSEKKIQPILLLDDIFDKLDRERIQQLLEIIIGNNFGQIFLSDTNETRINETFKETGEEITKFLIQSGKIV